MSKIIYPINTGLEYYFQEGCYIIEMLNDETDPEISIARARLEPGMTTQWHQLKNTTERYVIQHGRGLVEVGDEAPQEVKSGDVVLIPAMTAQRIANIGDKDLIFLAVCSPRFLPENYEELESNQHDLSLWHKPVGTL